MVSRLRKRSNCGLIIYTDDHESLYDLYNKKLTVEDPVNITNTWIMDNYIPTKIQHINVENPNGKNISYDIKYYFGIFKRKTIY
jgi:hypothetical protein